MSERDVFFTALMDCEKETGSKDQTRNLRLKYMQLLDKYPLTTKSCTSAMIGAIGAIIVGLTDKHYTSTVRGKEKRDQGIRWLDVFAHAICGAVQGPLGHYW